MTNSGKGTLLETIDWSFYLCIRIQFFVLYINMETFSQFYQKMVQEAEIVGQQVLDSERAALEILAPYRNSNDHFVSYMERGRIHTPKQGGIAEGVPVNEFLVNGFSGWSINDTWDRDSHKNKTRQMVLVEIIDPNASIACEDGTGGSNPYMWKQQGKDMIQTASNLGYIGKGYESMMKNNLNVSYKNPAAPPGSTTKPQDHPSDFNDADARYRSGLAGYIYGTLPHNLTTSINRAGSEKAAQHRGRLMRQTDVDIIMDRCPLSKATFVTVYNPRVIREVKQFGIRKDFEGMKKLSGNFLQATSNQDKEINAIQEQLNDIFADLEDRVDSLDKVLDQEKDEVYNYIHSDNPEGAEELLDRVLDMIGQVDKTSLNEIGRLFWKASRLIGMMGKKYGPDLGQRIWTDFGRPMKDGIHTLTASRMHYYAIFLKDMGRPQEEKLVLGWRKRILDTFNAFAAACGAEEMK